MKNLYIGLDLSITSTGLAIVTEHEVSLLQVCDPSVSRPKRVPHILVDDKVSIGHVLYERCAKDVPKDIKTVVDADAISGYIEREIHKYFRYPEHETDHITIHIAYEGLANGGSGNTLDLAMGSGVIKNAVRNIFIGCNVVWYQVAPISLKSRYTGHHDCEKKDIINKGVSCLGLGEKHTETILKSKSDDIFDAYALCWLMKEGLIEDCRCEKVKVKKKPKRLKVNNNAETGISIIIDEITKGAI